MTNDNEPFVKKSGKVIRKEGLVLLLKEGNGFSLNQDGNRYDILVKEKNHYTAELIVSYPNGVNVPISIPYGSEYYLKDVFGTKISPFKKRRDSRTSTRIRIVAPKEVKILRHDLEYKLNKSQTSKEA